MLNGMKSGFAGLSKIVSHYSSGKTKILALVIFNLLICNIIYSQSINLTLGSGGVFTLKDASTNYFSLSQSTGQVNILNTLRLENTSNSNTGIIFKGTNRFIHNYGPLNTFFGLNSGNLTMTGDNNTGVGINSLQNNTSRISKHSFWEQFFVIQYHRDQ